MQMNSQAVMKKTSRLFCGGWKKLQLSRISRSRGDPLTFVFEFDSAHRVLRCTFTGPITYEGLREYCKAATLHVRRADPVAVILDFTAAGTTKLFSGTVKALAGLQSGVPD